MSRFGSGIDERKFINLKAIVKTNLNKVMNESENYSNSIFPKPNNPQNSNSHLTGSYNLLQSANSHDRN